MSKKRADNTQILKRNRINRKLLPVGTKLEGKSKGKIYEAIVVKASTNPKHRALRVQDREYLSLSGAAMAVTGHATNGWVFWKVKSKP